MTKKAFLKLLPLLILYFVVFFAFVKNSTDYGDESRYAGYAENLTKGFYAPADTLLLWNGPGYPLVLTPFAFFGIPWIYAKMLNPPFFFLAVCFFYTAVRTFAPERGALFSAYLFGLYPPFYAELWLLLTEPFVLMLMSLFVLLTVRWFQTGRYRFLILAAIVCAFMALTKVFFGYVTSACLLLTLMLSRWSLMCRKSVAIYGFALLLCTPYLLYTYSLTGRIFYWANSGGLSLYWMTSPYPEEFGDWKSDVDVMTRPELARHRPFFEKLTGLDFVKKDELLKKQALRNIVNNPGKMVFNWASNLGRMWLNFPFSYKYQHPRTLLYTAPGSLLLTAVLFCVYPLVKRWESLPVAVVHSIGFCMVYLAGHSFLCAEARFLCPLVPFIFMIVTYTATNLVKVRLCEKKR
jgi:hypothetical protein